MDRRALEREWARLEAARGHCGCGGGCAPCQRARDEQRRLEESLGYGAEVLEEELSAEIGEEGGLLDEIAQVKEELERGDRAEAAASVSAALAGWLGGPWVSCVRARYEAEVARLVEEADVREGLHRDRRCVGALQRVGPRGLGPQGAGGRRGAGS